MDCPRCETPTLDERDRNGITIDTCLTCRGIWLDRGELEKLISRAIDEQADLERRARGHRDGGSRGHDAHDGDHEVARRHGDPDDRERFRDIADGDDRDHGSSRTRYEDSSRHGGHDAANPRTGKRRWFESLTDILD